MPVSSKGDFFKLEAIGLLRGTDWDGSLLDKEDNIKRGVRGLVLKYVEESRPEPTVDIFTREELATLRTIYATRHPMASKTKHHRQASRAAMALSQQFAGRKRFE
mmetsp:Transcript_7515/g.10455  ORF Transcript_7515/g.10455 Transcript_7515/m.10455 type:complete len:105 (+) Transcript_7515:62-376(+)